MRPARSLCVALFLAACSAENPADLSVSEAALRSPREVDVSNDQTAQNETPLAVNPTNPDNLITGNNDWNYNDGCGVNASFDGGRTWTSTFPTGFIPGITKYTDDPAVPGTGFDRATPRVCGPAPSSERTPTV